MKCAIVMADGLKQIMFSPENDMERMALKMITPEDNISIEIKEGTFFEGDMPKSALGYRVEKCQGGYHRAYRDSDSLMLVLRRKSQEEM